MIHGNEWESYIPSWGDYVPVKVAVLTGPNGSKTKVVHKLEGYEKTTEVSNIIDLVYTFLQEAPVGEELHIRIENMSRTRLDRLRDFEGY